MEEEFVCCICGKKFKGYGNNPWPLKEEGRCCDGCNEKVVEERMKKAFEENWTFNHIMKRL